MNDETYCFIEDIREKKQTARSAHNRRTHCGRSGKIRFGYENMTKKEIEAMSGEVKSYNVNKPMLWQEFKKMPVDLQQQYVDSLQDQFNVPQKAIANMFGIYDSTMNVYFKRNAIKARPIGKAKWDEEGFRTWCAGDREQTDATAPEAVQTVAAPVAVAVPDCGELHFCGSANEILQSICAVLGGAKVSLTVSWEIMGETEAANDGE